MGQTTDPYLSSLLMTVVVILGPRRSMSLCLESECIPPQVRTKLWSVCAWCYHQTIEHISKRTGLWQFLLVGLRQEKS
jgi:hypothetical protein